MGLCKEYELIRNQILASDPLPSVNQAHYRLQQVKMQKRIVNLDSPSDSEVAMHVQKHNSTSGSHFVPKSDFVRPDVKRQRPSCDYFGKHGHLKSFCYKYKRDSMKKDFRVSSTSHRSAPPDDSRGFVANVKELGFPAAEDTPLDYSTSQADPLLVQAVTKKVLKVIQSKTSGPYNKFRMSGSKC
ncbi:hypothetical protein RND81_09G031100 [Saponaria officinalis]|uniref:Uncharacterized protein n=1 Tax=Saponaria officinalis TaxID=3572 RepID=A0AAW1II47_SAPOF